MLGRNNPLKELEGNEYKLAREEGFTEGRRTGWIVSALVGIPSVTLAVIAGIGSLGIVLFPLAAIVGTLVVGAMVQMHSDRRHSKRAAELLLDQRELMEQKKEAEGAAPAMAPDGQAQGQPNPNMPPQQGQGATPPAGGPVPPQSGEYPPYGAPQPQPMPPYAQPAWGPQPVGAAMPPQGMQPAGMPPPPPVPPQGYGQPAMGPQTHPPQGYVPPQNYHGVTSSPQVAPGSVVGNYTANLSRGPAPAQGVPVRT